WLLPGRRGRQGGPPSRGAGHDRHHDRSGPPARQGGRRQPAPVARRQGRLVEERGGALPARAPRVGPAGGRVSEEACMSKIEDAVLALALGAGGGLVLWYPSRDEKADAAAAGKAPAPPPPAPPVPMPLPLPKVAGACSLKLDARGLTADGQRVDVAGAVERCK